MDKKLSKYKLSKIMGIVSICCGIVYFWMEKDYQHTFELVGALLTVLGVSGETVKVIQEIKGDLENIRNNPALPGTPVDSDFKGSNG